jgi:hypothetical protein
MTSLNRSRDGNVQNVASRWLKYSCPDEFFRPELDGLRPGQVTSRPGIAPCCGAKSVSPITEITRNRELRLHISARGRSVGSCGIQPPAKRANCWNFDGLSHLATSYLTVQLRSWAQRVIERYSGGTRFKPNQKTDSSDWGLPRFSQSLQPNTETVTPIKLVQEVILLTYIREVPSSNLGKDTDYPDWIFVILLSLSLRMPV